MERRTAIEQPVDKSQVLDALQVAAQLRGNKVHDFDREVEGGGIDGDVHDSGANKEFRGLIVSDEWKKKIQIGAISFQVGGCICSCVAQSESIIVIGGGC